MKRRFVLSLVMLLIILLAAFEVRAEQERIKVIGKARPQPALKDASLEIRAQGKFVVAFFDGIRKIAEKIAEKKGKLTVIKKENIITMNSHEKIGDFEVHSKAEVKMADEKTGELISDQIDIKYMNQEFVIQNYILISPPVESVKFIKWDNSPETISVIEIEDIKWLSDGSCEVWLSIPYEVVNAKIVEPPKEPILRIETGMHTATIRRIGVDAAGRYLDVQEFQCWDSSLRFAPFRMTDSRSVILSEAKNLI